MRRVILSLMFVLICSGDPRPLVVFVGDSITAGWDVATAFPGYFTINDGISGQTSTQILSRFNEAIRIHPAFIVIEAGINDPYFDLPDTETRVNISRMIDLAQAQSIMPILCSLLPTAPQWYDKRPPDRLAIMNDWLRQFAETRGIVYADYASVWNPTTMTRDGLHPNSLGYEVMQGTLIKVLQSHH